ncbi:MULTISPECIES: helix-turn-helix domain-containing protein [unclassified Caballeronia]|nr:MULTISPECIES: helix-turn-helix domain-containing protein [unclassified Caballeronia]
MPITLQSGVRFRAYPDAELASTLARWIGCQRFIYNGKVDEDRLFAAQRRLEVVSGNVEVKAPLDQAYAQFKDRELTPWLYEVPSQILRNGAVRWMNAKQRQLKKLANAPRRRTRRDFNSVHVTAELFRLV